MRWWNLKKKLLLGFSVLQGADAASRVPLPEGSRQVFVMSENLSSEQKEDVAWASYVLLRNTNTTSVVCFPVFRFLPVIQINMKLESCSSNRWNPFSSSFIVSTNYVLLGVAAALVKSSMYLWIVSYCLLE
jgi:hypothetical protein